MRNFINLLFSIKLISLSLNTCSLLPGTLFTAPLAWSHTLTESSMRKETYLLTPEAIKVEMSGPRDGKTAGKSERAYRRRLASSESSSSEVVAWVYRFFCEVAYVLEEASPKGVRGERALDHACNSSRVKDACSPP